MAFGNRIVDVKQTEPVKFGDRKETYPIGTNEQGQFVLATIDAYWFASPTNLRLKNMKSALAALKTQGVKQDNGLPYDSKWFDDNVRDPFHKVLKFAAQHSLDKGKPVSLAFTRRTNKATSEQVVTVKHGFEHTVVPAKPEQIAQKAAAKAAKQSEKRANRKAPKAPRITPLASVGEAAAGIPQAAQSEPQPAAA